MNTLHMIDFVIAFACGVIGGFFAGRNHALWCLAKFMHDVKKTDKQNRPL